MSICVCVFFPSLGFQFYKVHNRECRQDWPLLIYWQFQSIFIGTWKCFLCSTNCILTVYTFCLCVVIISLCLFKNSCFTLRAFHWFDKGQGLSTQTCNSHCWRKEGRGSLLDYKSFLLFFIFTLYSYLVFISKRKATYTSILRNEAGSVVITIFLQKLYCQERGYQNDTTGNVCLLKIIN